MPNLTLPDGRDLELEVSGPDGAPVLLFMHGTPGASAQLSSMAKAARDRGRRLVTWSRPGYGASTRRPGRSVADDTDDVSALLDHLGVDTCVVVGWSGGGPHALACGARLSDRVDGVLVIAGVAPYPSDGLDWMAGMGQENIEEFGLSLQGEDALRPYLEEQRVQLANVQAEDIIGAMETLLPPVDRAVLTGEFGDYLAREFRQAVARGIDGWVDDDLAFTRDWGFDLADIAVRTYLWQGTDDLMVPSAHGEWLADHLPGVTAHLEQAEGHLSVALGAMERMFDELTRNA